MIELENLTKIYNPGEPSETIALSDVTLKIDRKEFIAVMGPSGAGKSTLLNIIGCMQKMTSGSYLLDGNEINGLSMAKLHKLRKQYISFVFQDFALMNQYTIYENIELPMLARNLPGRERKKRVNQYMERLGIKSLSGKLPGKCSGGQKQRAAIARALASDTEIILADEPTGALDRGTSRDLMALFREINEEGKMILIVTHDPEVAESAKRIIHIVDGKVASDKRISI
jgi:putative ABC transport system ATP-binding protein